MMKKILAIYLTILIALSVLFLFKNAKTTTSAIEIPEYSCGDGVCTIPLEDEIACPEDCLQEEIDKFPIFLLALIILLMGIFYFNFYRGKADLRKLTKGKNPFKSKNDYMRVYNYIESSLKISMEKKKIVDNLYSKGWNKKQIIYAFEDAEWKQRKVLLETPPKVEPDLKPVEDYISRCRAVNIPDESIKKALLGKGWKKSNVRKAFRNLVHG